MKYIVTAVKELTAKRRLVYLNDEPAFALYAGELRKYQIAVQQELEEALYLEILSILSKRAVARSMNLLKSKDYTEAELVCRLRQGYYPPEAVCRAVDYVKQFGYIDDFRYAANYVEFQAGRKSRRQIEGFLSARGIARDLIEQVCGAYYADHGDSELQQVVRQMEKKLLHVQGAEPDYTQRQKVMAFFYRKGYPADVVKKALDIVVDARYNN